MGLAQTERLDELIARKREIFAAYAARLGEVPGIKLNAEPDGVLNSYWMVTVIFPERFAGRKPALMDAFRKQGIATRPMFDPLSDIPAFAGTAQAQAARQRNSVSYDLAPRGLNLPSGYNLTTDDIDYICDAVKQLLQAGPE